jgi:hypothetical protein
MSSKSAVLIQDQEKVSFFKNLVFACVTWHSKDNNEDGRRLD